MVRGKQDITNAVTFHGYQAAWGKKADWEAIQEALVDILYVYMCMLFIIQSETSNKLQLQDL